MKLLLTLLSFLPLVLRAQGQLDFSVENIASLGLPVVIATTEGGEEPTCDIVHAPPGEDGVTITNVKKLPGRVLIMIGTDTVYDSGPYCKGLSGMKIRVRGNTSAQWNKKPFKINLQQPADLLLRGDEHYADREWALLTDCDILDEIGLRVNALCGLQWTPGMCHVNVFLNGDYRGIYTLMENVRRNENGARLDVADDGYIFERDPYWWNDMEYFATSTSREYTFKYPEKEELSWPDIEYCRQLMEDVERAIRKGRYAELIDVDSWASWLLAHDILGTSDSGGSNIFLTKYDSSPQSKLMMGNLWDFGSTFRRSTAEWSRIHTAGFFYFPDLLASPSKAFTRAYKAKWAEVKPRLQELYANMSHSLTLADNQGINLSNPYEMARWNYSDATDVESLWSDCRRYLNARAYWLDNAISRLQDADDFTGIDPAEADGADTPLCNLAGQRVAAPREPGVYISRGKKVVIRQPIAEQ